MERTDVEHGFCHISNVLSAEAQTKGVLGQNSESLLSTFLRPNIVIYAFKAKAWIPALYAL